MKTILKTMMGLILSLFTLNAAVPAYEREDSAIAAFASTMVNVNSTEMFDALDTYFTYNPTLTKLHQDGVYGSLAMCPPAGQKGTLESFFNFATYATCIKLCCCNGAVRVYDSMS